MSNTFNILCDILTTYLTVKHTKTTDLYKMLVGNRKMAARTLPVASLPAGNLERHEQSSHI